MRLTFPDGSALDVEPIGTTSKGAPVVDDDTALQIAEAWQDVQGIDEYRGWTAPDDDSQPEILHDTLLCSARLSAARQLTAIAGLGSCSRLWQLPVP